jgi:uncharacterized membrane protein
MSTPCAAGWAADVHAGTPTGQTVPALMQSAAQQGRPLSLPELDVFRGLAAVFMVVNHAGFRLWAAADTQLGWATAVLLISSYAPALFFFATGLGIGLRPERRDTVVRDTFYKAGLLVLADQLSHWRGGVWAGLDFFSFIALSMLIVTALSFTGRPARWAVGLFIGVVALRYVVGPVCKNTWPTTGWVQALVGVYGQPGVAYPLAPWLCFPLAGFLLGTAARHRMLSSDRQALAGSGARNGLSAAPAWVMAAAALLIGAIAAAMLNTVGASFHRWGTVGIGFFALSLAVIGAVWLVSQAVSRWTPRVAAGLSLRGVAAFLVVPLHYGALEALTRLGWSALASSLFVPTVIALCGVALVAARVGERWALRLSRVDGAVLPVAVFVVAIACIVAVFVSATRGNSGWAFTAATVAQLLVAYGLGKRLVAKGPPAPAAASADSRLVRTP